MPTHENEKIPHTRHNFLRSGLCEKGLRGREDVIRLSEECVAHGRRKLANYNDDSHGAAGWRSPVTMDT